MPKEERASETEPAPRPSNPHAETDLDGSPFREPVLTKEGLVGLAVVALVVVVLAGARAASDLVSQTLLGVVLAVGVAPVLQATRRRGWPDIVGAILASLALVVLVSGFGILLAFAGSQLAQEFPRFRKSLESARQRLKEDLVDRDLEPLLAVVDRSVDLSGLDLVSPLLEAASSVGSIGFVLFVAFFTVFEAPTFELKWLSITTRDSKARANAGRVLADVQRYLLVKTATCIATGLLVGMWTALLGLDAAVLWGLLAFALNYIPFIGSLLASIPPIVVALLNIDVITGVGVAAGIFFVNFLVGNIIEPRVMGRTMGLSPLVVLLSVALWGWVLGPVGALLSVPLTVIVKIVLERSARYAWVAVLLDAPGRFRS